ncbi:MAG: SDR family NAD(P)-dependent oxidoreductase [Gammaproteobacteria bacterium]|nr:SDR family NAD(P)-dependent oxidoreductase [Gammaproteobacteria bacterium]
MHNDPKNIVITGASSGIGEALARAYAAPGVTLHLAGRNADRLEAVADSVRQKNANAQIKVIDVADRDAMFAWIGAADDEAPLDLVIANAGIGLGKNDAPTLAELTERTFDTNVQGVFNTIHPALERMVPRRRGQVAIMSSVAGLLGMPGAAPYAASKAAVRSYGEGLRGAYHRHGVAINVICPGFVESGMTARNRFRMPFLMDADKAAHKIVRGLARNKARIAFPWQTYSFIRLLQMLPVAWADRLLRRSPQK